jgi:hypothetical protein
LSVLERVGRLREIGVLTRIGEEERKWPAPTRGVGFPKFADGGQGELVAFAAVQGNPERLAYKREKIGAG